MMRVISTPLPSVLLCTVCRAARLIPFLLILPAFPQRNTAAFGLCSETGVTSHVSGVAIRPALRTVPAEIAVVSSRSRGLDLHVFDARGSWTSRRAWEFDSPRRFLRAADIDRDGAPEYITLAHSGRTLSVLRKKRRSFAETVIPLQEEATTVIPADLNSDGRVDLLACGPTMAGVICAWGNRGGTFSVHSLLFGESSASDCRVADLNGDGISDILVLDWLSDRLVLWFGISDTIFSEQVSVDLPGEPQRLALADVRPGRSLRVAVTLPEREAVFVYTVNAAGEFFLEGTIPCPAPPSDVQFTDVTGDGLADVITATDSGLVVAAARTRSRFFPPMVYGVLTRGGLWDVADLDGDRRRDLVAVDNRQRRVIAAANAEHSSVYAWPNSYLTGLEPTGVAVTDVDLDGLDDIVVANSGSASLSAFRGRAGGVFRPGVFIPVPERPRWVSSVAGRDVGRPLLVVEHPRGSMIVVVDPADDLSRSTADVLPTGPSPVLLAATKKNRSELRFLIRTASGRGGSPMASIFEQIGPQRYLERQLRTQHLVRIMALGTGDFSSKGTYDLVVAAVQPRSPGISLSLAVASDNDEYPTVTPLLQFTDSLTRVDDIAAQDVDGDGRLDILLFPPLRSREGLGVLYGAGEGHFNDTVSWIPQVHPASRRHFVVRDINADRIPDIVALDNVSKEVVGLFGTGARSFSAPVRVADGKGVSGIALGSFEAGGGFDLVLVSDKKGSMTIVRNSFSHGMQ